MSLAAPFIANTDKRWFDFLSTKASAGVVDEVNFWSPSAERPMKRMQPGEPVFFRLKSPDNAIAGYGFFAHFQLVRIDLAWEIFGYKNGDPDRGTFYRRIAAYRGVDPTSLLDFPSPLACTVLRQAHFWPDPSWIPWGEDRGWRRNIVQGRTEDDAARAELLLSMVRRDGVTAPGDLAGAFRPSGIDRRTWMERQVAEREGQGTFRLRLLGAWNGSCAITGEHTELVLDAAHIEPYRGPQSNHVQNGLLLTKEFHALFDAGYLTVTPEEHRVLVSPRLYKDWNNGRRFRPYDGQPLDHLPARPELRPSAEVLDWHRRTVFRG